MAKGVHLFLDVLLVVVCAIKILGGKGNFDDYFEVYGFIVIAVLDIIRVIVQNSTGDGSVC